MKRIGFIGAGNMAEAIIRGILESKSAKKRDITASDKDGERLTYISREYGIATVHENRDVVQNSDYVFLSVKPGVINPVLSEIKNIAISKKIFISIAAGISTSSIKKAVGKNIRLIRVMPNAASFALEGASVVYFGEEFSQDEKQSALGLFNSFGVTYEIESENFMDAVTGLSGSGPAFVSIFVESLADAGVKMGLSRDLALKLAIQTVYGSSKLMMESGKHPGEVKDMVSSPGGTTISGVHKLEEKGFRDAVISAVEAATLRSMQLSDKE